MDTMKDRSRITNEMDKVCTSYYLFFAIFFMLWFIGSYFFDNGETYEGEWKDGNRHGQGMKEVIYLMFYWFYHCLMVQ